MASPTKIIEAIRKHKRDKRRTHREKRVRKELAKIAQATDVELRRFIPGTMAK
jgi:hypothetical protein